MAKEQRVYAVSIMASKRNGTLSIGVTGDPPMRVTQHRDGLVAGFTKRYDVNNLVWFEPFDLVELAIQREKTMKTWPQQWKINLIAAANPDWRDLYEQIH